MERNEQEKAHELYMKIGELIPDYSASEVANALIHGLGIVLGHQDATKVDRLIDNIVLSLRHDQQAFRQYQKENPCNHGEK